MLSLLLPVETVENVSTLIFSTFDKDNSGSLNFVEFVTSIHCMSTSSPEVRRYTCWVAMYLHYPPSLLAPPSQDKLRWVFQLYDSDGSGAISLTEMVTLFACLYQTEGLDKRIAVERAEAVFGNLDVNGDGDISVEEFVKGCLQVEFAMFRYSRLSILFRTRIWLEC